jgi:hypothetical protein
MDRGEGTRWVIGETNNLVLGCSGHFRQREKLHCWPREKLCCCEKMLEIVNGIVEQPLLCWPREKRRCCGKMLEIVNVIVEQSVKNVEMWE